MTTCPPRARTGTRSERSLGSPASLVSSWQSSPLLGISRLAARRDNPQEWCSHLRCRLRQLRPLLLRFRVRLIQSAEDPDSNASTQSATILDIQVSIRVGKVGRDRAWATNCAGCGPAFDVVVLTDNGPATDDCYMKWKLIRDGRLRPLIAGGETNCDLIYPEPTNGAPPGPTG